MLTDYKRLCASAGAEPCQFSSSIRRPAPIQPSEVSLAVPPLAWLAGTHGRNCVSDRITFSTTPLVILAGVENLIGGGRAWKLSLVKFDFTSSSLFPVYLPSSSDTASGGGLTAQTSSEHPYGPLSLPSTAPTILPARTLAMQELNEPLVSLWCCECRGSPWGLPLSGQCL